MRCLIPAAILGFGPLGAMAAPPEIVADTPVTGSLVQQVLGDLGEVRVLIDKGGDPHHYQMRPSDARALQSAGVLFWIGPELTPWLERAATGLGQSKSLSLLHAEGTQLRSYAESGHDEHDDHDGHDHSGVDAHAWLDPTNAEIWLGTIANSLSELDPDNAATYAANAEAARSRLAALDAEIAAKLAPVAQMPFVVFHDAYGYFTTHYGLTPAIAVSLGDASAPSAARLAEIHSQIIDSKAVCAFPEFGHDPSLIDSVIQGIDIRVGAELDPAGRALTDEASLYETVLQGLSSTLTDCLSAPS
ncbi:zinc ABC transporter substrate-binding protein [Paracoccus sp. (in: a-proteobacteria)]|uniref:zinc ABC transporter substrate-binding protein n=1 Tax=Paracoccus sp. TaxID=267 RepID=UPI003A845698